MSARFPLCAVAVTAIWALAACTTVGPDFQRPASPSAAAGYAMAGEGAPASVRLDPEARTGGAWWQTFGSQALNQTIRLALEDNPGVAEAQATLERYQAAEAEVAGQRKAQAELTANAQRQKFNSQAFGFKGGASSFPGFGTSRTFNLYSLGGRVSYDLDLFGGGRRQVEEAGARTEHAARMADAAYLTLSGSVALQAMRIAGLRDEIKAIDAIVEDDRTLLGLAHKALDLGGIPRTTLTGVEVQLAEDEAILPPLRREYEIARHRLALLVGKSPADWTAPDFDLAQMAVPASVPVSLPSGLIRQRPDILAAEADLHAATAAIGVRIADQYPDLRLSANGALSALSPGNVISTDSTGYTLLAGLTAPLFDGGARKARTRAAEAEARLALARYRQTVLKAFTEVSDSLAALSRDQEELDALVSAVAHSQQLADDTLAAARLGARTAGDVIQSRRQLDRDKRGLAQARARRLSDLVSLYVASAADWRETRTAGSIGGGPSGGGHSGVGPGR